MQKSEKKYNLEKPQSLPQKLRLKINVSRNFFELGGLEEARTYGVKKKLQKTLILAFEVMVQNHLQLHIIYCTNFFPILVHCDIVAIYI